MEKTELLVKKYKELETKKIYLLSFTLIILLASITMVFNSSKIYSSNIEVNKDISEADRQYKNEIEYKNVSKVLEKELRIVVLGDSISSAYKLESRKYSWPNLMEEKLRQDGKDAKIINLAEPATGVEEHADKYVKQGHLYQPDIVLIQLSNEDFFDYDIFQEMKRENLSYSNNSIESKNEKLWNSYVERALSRSNSYKLERYREHLDRIRSKEKPNQSYYIIHSHSGYNHLENLGSFFRNYTKRKGWNYIDWREFQKDEAKKSEIVNKEDKQHYNRLGNEIWARKLYQFLSREEAFEKYT